MGKVHALLFLKYSMLACPLKLSGLHVALEVVSNSFVPICNSCTAVARIPVPSVRGQDSLRTMG